jgi:hypothetical protein
MNVRLVREVCLNCSRGDTIPLMRKRKEEVQRADLERFVAKYFPQRPEGLEHGDKPDLTFANDGKTVGIEHTRIFWPPDSISGAAPHAQQAAQHQIVKTAWEQHSALSPRKLWLLVAFENKTTYKKREIQAVASSLARVAHEGAAHIPCQPEQIVWHKVGSWEYQRQGREFPPGITRIDFQVVDHKPGLELWGPRYAYMVPHLSAERVQEIVSAKEAKLKDYRVRCDECWLLIVVDTGVPSSHFEVDEDLVATEFSTSFSKLVVFRSVHAEIFELTRPRHVAVS